MKRILIILLLIPSIALAGWLPWGKKDAPEPTPPPEPEKPKICFLSLHVSGASEEPKVYFIFRAPCGEIRQVGIIDETQHKIFTVDNLKVSSGFEYFGEMKKKQYIDGTWPGIAPIEFYKK